MNRPATHLNQHPRPKSPRATDRLDEILIEDSARASAAISLHGAGSRTTEGCWYCSPHHSVPRGQEPEKCWECLQDERVGIERMQAK